MSYLDSLSEGEYETALAATAYAITTLEEEEDSSKEKKTVDGLARTKSKLEGKTGRTSFNWSFKWLSGKEAREDEKQTGDTVLHKTVEVERATRGNYSSRYTDVREDSDDSPTVRKMPTSTKRNPNEKDTKRLQSDKERMVGTKAPYTTKPKEFSSGYKIWDEDSNEPSKAETEADAWKKEEMINANNRYEKMMSVISEWQVEKRAKAKRKMDRKQGGPENKRDKALKQYNNKISRINQIAGDAKALAKERKHNDEMKIREKAAKIKLTGKVPGAFCTCC